MENSPYSITLRQAQELIEQKKLISELSRPTLEALAVHLIVMLYECQNAAKIYTKNQITKGLI